MQPTELKRLFPDLQDVMLVQLGTLKIFATEHRVLSAQEDSTRTKKRRKVAKIVSQIQRPKRMEEQ